jgi:hypothetical protein
VIRLSAKNGVGFESLVQCLQQQASFGKRMMDVDYDIYAEGEAELGWLNGQAKLSSAQPVSLDSFLMSLLQELHQGLIARDAEVAHLKVIGMTDGVYAVANLVSNADLPVLSLPSNWEGCEADLVVNARVAIAPEELESLVRRTMEQLGDGSRLSVEIKTIQCFRPGRPVPTHRIES